MSEETTRDMTDARSFEERVLAEFAALRREVGDINTRLTSLEDKVDARLRETRPIWEDVRSRLANIESELSNMNRQFRSLIADLFQVRVRVEKLEDNQPAA